jgi:hypothetical protein
LGILVASETRSRRTQHKKELIVIKREYNGIPRQHPLRTIWTGMKTRCYSPNRREYRWYGAKGIAVCDEWFNSFTRFYEWAMRTGWQRGLTIDRIDSDKDYSPDNCRWATMKQQNNNRKNNVHVTHNGETRSLIEWAQHPDCKVTYKLLYERIKVLGMSFGEAFTRPARPCCRN